MTRKSYVIYTFQGKKTIHTKALNQEEAWLPEQSEKRAVFVSM